MRVNKSGKKRGGGVKWRKTVHGGKISEKCTVGSGAKTKYQGATKILVLVQGGKKNPNFGTGGGTKCRTGRYPSRPMGVACFARTLKLNLIKIKQQLN